MENNYDFEIIAGSYEEFLLGYLCSTENKKVKQSFASHDHSSSIRCVAYCGHYLASGAADDRIIIYDLETRKECHMLVHHESTVTCLKFTKDHSHLISGSADGVLAITRVGNWQIEKKWDKAHKGTAIFDIAIHPSGKLALTIGGDSTLRTWNLVKGRQAYAINLNSKSKDAKSLEKILWGPDGSHFLLYGGKFTEIWNIEEGGITKSIDYSEKVTSCVWISMNKILVGHENGSLTSVKLKKSTKTSYNAHNSRIKSLEVYKDWVVSISSNGEFKIWSEKVDELLKENTGCRLTCMCVVPVIEVKKEEIEEEEEIQDLDESLIVKSRVVITEEPEDDQFEQDAQDRPKKKRKQK